MKISELKKLRSLAKRLLVAIKTRDRYGQEANYMLKILTPKERLNPTTNSTKDIVYEIQNRQFHMIYSHRNVVELAKKIKHNFPEFANKTPENIINYVNRRLVTPKIISGRL